MSPSQSKKLPYRTLISRASAERRTRLILAVDTEGGGSGRLLQKSKELVDGTLEYLCAVKVGRRTVLELGPSRTRALTRIVQRDNVPCIVDDKTNDIGDISLGMAEAYFQMGFDGLTANPFVGWRGGLQPLFQRAHRKGKGIILLVYMSHPGASEGYGQRVLKDGRKPASQYRIFAEKALRWGADGVVVGATRPLIIREVKSILQQEVPIYSPGIGSQGGKLALSARAGTDYFIVGRSITGTDDPQAAALRYARESWKSQVPQC